MKIYTKMGDGGETTLASGKKVSKSHSRVALYGTCDELNSLLGLALSFAPKEMDSRFLNSIKEIQSLLFEVGSELAGYLPPDKKDSILEEADVLKLEAEIDRMTEALVPLKSFVIPGGSSFASFLHVARTVCRRLEREMVVTQEKESGISSVTRIFINRLSDYLFTAARYANQTLKVEEPLWKSRTKT